MNESRVSAEPVFLFSLPRSGSTLLQRMLSCHPDIATHSELWFLLPHLDAIENKYFQSVYSANSLNNATRGLLEQLPDGSDDYYRAIRALRIYEGTTEIQQLIVARYLLKGRAT